MLLRQSTAPSQPQFGTRSRTARTTETSKTFKPKRDANNIIQCKSEKDQESCIYADNVRKIRQREYDNAILYTAFGTGQYIAPALSDVAQKYEIGRIFGFYRGCKPNHRQYQQFDKCPKKKTEQQRYPRQERRRIATKQSFRTTVNILKLVCKRRRQKTAAVILRLLLLFFVPLHRKEFKNRTSTNLEPKII